MKRREFISLIGSAVATWPLGARAQQAVKIPVIGFLGAGSALTSTQWVAAFVQRLRELGWVEGSNIAINIRWAEGHDELLPEIAAEFVRRKVDVIVAQATQAVVAAKQATAVIPIVFPAAGDPVGSGLVASLGRPEGNVTGMSVQFTDLAGKRLEILREVVPGIRRLAILANTDSHGAVLEMEEVQTAARTFGIETLLLEIRRADDIEPAIDALKGRAEALYVISDPFTNTNRIRINDFALNARMPTMHAFREHVEAKGLVSYGPNLSVLYRRAAEFVDRILRGAKPGDLPVEQPTKFDLVINLKTAKALSLTVPPTLLARADEVIE